MREILLKNQPTWGLRRAQGTGQKSATPATLTKVILVLLTMFLIPSAAWADYTYGDSEELFFNYEEDSRVFSSSNGTIWKASLSGDNPSWPAVTDYNTTPVTVSPFTNFDALKLTLQSKLKGTLTGFALSGTVTSEAHVIIKVYRLTAKDATTGTEIGSIAITGGATPTYTYTATTTNGVTQEFNNEYIQLAFEHTGGDASSIAYDAITGITLTFSGTSYNLSVDDCRVTSNNATDILGDSKVSFSSNTLTLSEGASLTNITYSGSEDLTIAFSGTVTINGEQSGSACIKATKPSKLIFTSSNGSLVLQGNGEYGVIQDFSDVNFGILNLASSQSSGLYYNWDDNEEWGTMTDYNGSSVTNMTITTATTFYPIWVMNRQGTPAHTQLTSETSSVDMVRKIGGEDGEDVVICTVSYDATNGKLIIEANEEAENNGYAFQPGSSTAAIVVGPSMEELKVHLKGKTKITDSDSFVFSIWDTTSLIFTTDETSPGSLTGTEIVNWKSKNSGGTGQITYENGLVFNYDSSTSTETISTTGARIKIGEGGSETVISASTDENGLFNGKVFFDASNNTLTLKGATLGNIDSYGIKVFVDDLKVVISGENTILGDITYSGNSGQSSSIQINKATDEATLTLSGIDSFGACIWGEGLYLTAFGQGTTNAIAPHYEYSNGEGHFCDYSGSSVSNVIFSTTVSYPLWVGGVQVTDDNKDGITGITYTVGQGSYTSISGTVSFNPTGNILKLTNVTLSSPLSDCGAPIISNLPNLEIDVNGLCNLSGYRADFISDGTGGIKSVNADATLVISTNYTTSSGTDSPTMQIDTYDPIASGFKSISTDNQMIYKRTSNYYLVQRIAQPTISLVNGSLLLSDKNEIDLSYTQNSAVTLKYKITDAAGTAGEEKIFDSNTNEPIENPCTIDAWAVYQSQESELVTGKYFGIADKTIVFSSTTSGSVLTTDDLEISPATEDVTFTIVNAYNSSVISYDAENGATIVGIGACNIDVKIDVDEGSNIQILNTPTLNPDSPGQQTVYIITKNITVIPDNPSIEKDAEHDYLETDKITISRTPVDNDDLPIFYTWSDDVEVETYQYIAEGGSVSIYNGPIPAQTGTLRAWVGYSAGDNYYYNSEVVSETFTVKTDISNFNVRNKETTAAFEPTATYTGTAIVPEFTVVDEKGTTLASTNYIVSYQSVEIVAGDEGSGSSIKYTDVEQMVDVGSYRIVITGTGDSYGGTKTVDFAINKANLGIVTIESIADQTYTGSDIEPEITVKLNGNTLTASAYGFSIGYSNNINVATTEAQNPPTVTITATEGSNYFTAGTTQMAYFNIVQKSLTDESISVTLSASSFTYNGDLQYPEITVKDGETTLTSEAYGYYYSQDGETVDGPASVGTYTLTISGEGNYTGEITREITITPKEVATTDITVTLATTSYTYDGTAHTPGVSSVSITEDGESITLDTEDYDTDDIGYSNNVNAALATATEKAPSVTLSLKGNYSGTGVATFTIEQADLSGYVVTGLTTPTPYTGSPITPAFSVKATEEAETSLTLNTDYSVKYQQAGADVAEMKDAGAYKIIITGEGNYKGSLDADFTIDRATLNLTINLEGWTYGDTPNVPSLDGNLDEGAITWEYKATGADTYSAWSTLTTTTDAGTYMVRATVAETDNYAGGSKEAEFVIEQLDISQADITLDNTVLTYNGEQQTVNVTKVMAGDIEVPIDCYEVSGNTEKEAGDYKLTVTAKTMDSSGNPIKNNFTGSAEKAWKININHRTASAEELGFRSETQTASTYYDPNEDFNLPEGYVGYIITGINGNSVTTQRVSYIPKGVAVLVEKGQSSESANDIIPYPSNLPLKGTLEPVDVTSITGGIVYVLYNGEFVKSTSGTIPSHRCYLLVATNVASGTRSFSIDHGDGTTALREVKSEGVKGEKLADGEWYTLQGRKFTTKPTKPGLYILNGKKVVIK